MLTTNATSVLEIVSVMKGEVNGLFVILHNNLHQRSFKQHYSAQLRMIIQRDTATDTQLQ